LRRHLHLRCAQVQVQVSNFTNGGKIAHPLAPAALPAYFAGQVTGCPHRRPSRPVSRPERGAGRAEKRRPRNDSGLFLKTYDELLGNLHFDRSTLILDLMSGLIILVLFLPEGMTYAG
jgi:hypothetical protein